MSQCHGLAIRMNDLYNMLVRKQSYYSLVDNIEKLKIDYCEVYYFQNKKNSKRKR